MDIQKSLITKIAWSYYINNKTQQQIADMMGISRVKVTRYLQKARDLGIVNISVALDDAHCYEKEERLKELLKINEVSVVPCVENEQKVDNGVGAVTAMRMNQLLSADDILGVAWGLTLYIVAKNLKPVKRKNGKQIEVVQLMGGLTKSDKINPEEVVKTFATRLDANGNWLNMPAIVGSKEARDILMNDASIAQVFQKGKECTICLLGLGNLSVYSSVYLSGSYSKEDLRVLKEAGAVGDILSRPYDIDGKPIKIPLSERIIAVPLDEIKKIKKRIAVAVGVQKVKTIIGAARGGYINELVTDEITADEIVSYINDRK